MFFRAHERTLLFLTIRIERFEQLHGPSLYEDLRIGSFIPRI